MNATEAAILRAIGSRPDTRLFRNTVGAGWTGHTLRVEAGGLVLLRGARRVTFGLAPGSADLIGWHSRIVTEADFGRRIALFLAIEAKSGSGRATSSQRQFLARVAEAGGLAGVATSVEAARRIIEEAGP